MSLSCEEFKKAGQIIFVSLILVSCKKAEVVIPEEPKVTSELVNGLPQNIKKISGYLYAEFLKYNRLNNRNTALHLFSTFSDPSDNLLKSYSHYSSNIFNSAKVAFGNIDVGKTTFNDIYQLQPQIFQQNISYSYGWYAMPGNFASWQTEGNKTFAPLNINVNRGFPSMDIDSTSVALISKSGFTLDLTDKVFNCDSLIVFIVNWSGRVLAHKGMSKPATIFFSANDFSGIYEWETTGCIDICGFNYSNKIIDNRVYVFELSRKYSQSITFVP